MRKPQAFLAGFAAVATLVLCLSVGLLAEWPGGCSTDSCSYWGPIWGQCAATVTSDGVECWCNTTFLGVPVGGQEDACDAPYQIAVAR